MAPSFLTAVSHPKRLLTDHLISVADSVSTYLKISVRGIRELAISIGISHDLGKATVEFQKYILADESEKWKFGGHQKDHSAISSAITLGLSLHILKVAGFKKEEAAFLSLMSAICVRKHHGDIDFEFDGYSTHYLEHELMENYTNDKLAEKLPLDDIIKWLNLQLPRFNISASPVSADILLKYEELDHLFIQTAEFKERFFSARNAFILFELYSLLLGADKLDATFAGQAPDYNSIPRLPISLVENYRRMEFGVPKTKIDKIRSEIALKTKDNLVLNLDKKLFTLTAPTGSGKTLTAFDMALKLAENISAPIIYCLPFTSIIDQNFEEAEKIYNKNKIPIKEDLLLKHHHLAPMIYKKVNGDYEYDEDKQEMLVETWQSRFVITTFVQLFDTLFSGRNRNLKKQFLIPGAVVILDEVQAIPRKHWGLFRETAKYFAEEYGTRFILMTATQPGIFSDLGATELLPEHIKYFHALSRIKLNLHINKESTVEDLADMIYEDYVEEPKRKIIAVVNTISDSINLFNNLKKRPAMKDDHLFYLSSNIIPIDRRERIQRLKKAKHWMLVSTQVIEAGVDISADIVYRDFAPLDSVVQTAGRCNRNDSGKPGSMHLLKIKNRDSKRASARMVYDSVLLDIAEELLNDKKGIIEESDFIQIVKSYFSLVWKRGSDNDCLNYLKNFEFDRLGKNSHLIEEEGNTNQYFVIKKNDPKAEKLWAKFEKIQQIKDFKERKKKFLAIKPAFLDRLVVARQTERNDKVLLAYEPNDYDPITGYIKKRDNIGCAIF